MTSSALQGDSSSSTHPCTYHVFLSFRGIDTRTNFTAHLEQALRQNGINTFMDKRIREGEEISTTLLEAIEKSETSIIVFSKNYASSPWCLDELIKIFDCQKEKKQKILPLFYNVKPSELRHQANSIGEGSAKLKDRIDEKVQSWTKALKQAADLKGKELESKNEPDFIREIIEWVNLNIEKKTYIEAVDNPVGIDIHVQRLISLLNIGRIDSSYMVGIFGIGGIGKTTIAKAVYNSIASKFERICFLEDIGQTFKRNGMIHFQNQLLSMILEGPSLKINNVDQGITLIKERLRTSRILLVLDGVDLLDQLQNLAGKLDWFGLGSRTIITTRDRSLLTRHDVDFTHQHQVKELDDNEALKLFSLHAFNGLRPDSEYLEVLKDVVCYSGGLPLALKEIGSVLKGRDICFWKEKLKEYKKTPNAKIQEKLRISYDGLSRSEKDIFLHIACFFIGEKAKYVKQILEICDFPTYCAFIELMDKCLITESGGSLVMHNLLQEMGRDVVRQESPNKPGKRSRLWLYEDIRRVLEEATGTYKVTGIVIDSPEADLIQLSPDAFMEMTNLKLFIIRNGRFSGKLHSLPKRLRFLCWHGYTEESLPSNFCGKYLIALIMPHSCLKELNGIKTFENLTIMNLSNCKFLEVLDVSSISKLTTLILDGCVSLVTVHHSVRLLHKLVCLSLVNCKKLREISELLPMLGRIDLPNCHELHENMGNDLRIRLLSEEHPKDHKFVCMFPGDKTPDWISHSKKDLNSNSCKIDINEPAHSDGEMTRIALYAVIGAKADIPEVQDELIKGGQDEDANGIIFEVIINDGVEIYSFMEDNIPGQFHSDHVRFYYKVPKSFKRKGDNLQVKFTLRSASMFFKSCGFHLVRRNEEKVVDLMDGVPFSKRCRDDDGDDGNLGSNRYPQQKRHSSTLGIGILDAEDTPLRE